MNELTDDERRTKIGEACPDLVVKDVDGKYVWRGRSPEQRFDPLADLNAMHEAEKSLASNDYIDYIKNLKRIVCLEAEFNGPTWSKWAESTTAHQRVEAFGRTLGLW